MNKRSDFVLFVYPLHILCRKCMTLNTGVNAEMLLPGNKSDTQTLD